MKKLEYLDTAKGQAKLKFLRDVNRFFIIIDHEPKSKKSITKEEIKLFQEQILNKLKERKKRIFKKGVVLFLLFDVTKHDAPQIQTLAKNYIDLLGKNKCNNSNRKWLLFKDDNQIDILIVGCHKSKDKNGIMIQAQSVNNFIKDLNLLHRINYGYFTDYQDDYHIEYKNEYNYEYNYDDDDLNLRTIEELEKNKEKIIKEKGIKKFNELKDFYIGKYQKKGLNNYFSLNILMDLFQENFIDSITEQRIKKNLNGKLRGFENIKDMYIEMILKDSVALNIGKLPDKDGDSIILKEKINLSLNQFLKKRIYLKNLRVPLKITLIVMQPSNKYSNKDLDNIMRDYIIPKINKSFNPKFIASYEVINLRPKEKKYLNPGEMRLFLSECDHGFDNIRHNLDKEIDKREDYFK